MTKLKVPWLLVIHLVMGVAGAVGLASSIAAWPEVFLFGKVLHLPEFARGFPWPLRFPSAWILLCLLGPALTAPSVRMGGSTLVAALVAGAAIGCPWRAGEYGISNYLFNVGWVAIFWGLIPLAASGLLMLAAVRMRQRGRIGLSPIKSSESPKT